jgi:membrane-associated phospholipid phosphatase
VARTRSAHQWPAHPHSTTMHSLLEPILRLDAKVYDLLSQFHGNWVLDHLADHQESNTLLKSGLFVAAYWYFWFRNDADQQTRRQTILIIVGATLLGLVAARLISTIAPYRLRPMYDPNLQHHPLSIPTRKGFMNWSSFPSDHAAYLSALGFGLICLSRRLAIPVVLYVAGWICLPRMYLGIHYASDIIVGAGIGVATVWLALASGSVPSRVARPILAFADAKPQIFYPTAFLLLYEMTMIFWDIREPVHAMLHAASVVRHTVIGDALILLGALGVIAILIGRHRRAKTRKEDSERTSPPTR